VGVVSYYVVAVAILNVKRVLGIQRLCIWRESFTWVQRSELYFECLSLMQPPLWMNKH